MDSQGLKVEAHHAGMEVLVHLRFIRVLVNGLQGSLRLHKWRVSMHTRNRGGSESSAQETWVHWFRQQVGIHSAGLTRVGAVRKKGQWQGYKAAWPLHG